MTEIPLQRAVAVVDDAAVERNCRRLADELADGVRLCAVVKADGYGHGAVECARAALAGGASWLAVAAAAEAAELRRHLADARILTMGALTEAELDDALAVASDVAVWQPAFAELVAERGRELGIRPRIHVKYDTGMGRLGRAGSRRGPLARRSAWRPTRGSSSWGSGRTSRPPTSRTRRSSASSSSSSRVWPSAFAPITRTSSSTPPTAPRRCGRQIPTSTWSAAGSPSTASIRSRPIPLAQRLEPALELRSYVADVKLFEAGASAGYGQRWRAPADTWVGVLPIGYGDGVRRGLTNNADALVGGARYPLVGTVSMDNVTIDVGPDPAVRAGSPAVLIGPQADERILCEEVARRLGTINYEITCGISARVPRVHVRSQGP